MARTLLCLVFALMAFAGAQERAFDVFYFGMDRDQVREAAAAYGYLPLLEDQNSPDSWCDKAEGSQFPECFLFDDLVTIIPGFDVNFENLWTIRITASFGSDADPVKALAGSLGEPDKVEFIGSCVESTWTKGHLMYKTSEPISPSATDCLPIAGIAHLELLQLAADLQVDFMLEPAPSRDTLEDRFGIY